MYCFEDFDIVFEFVVWNGFECDECFDYVDVCY